MTLQYDYWYLSSPRLSPRLDCDPLAQRRTAKIVCPANPSHKYSGKRLGDLHLVLPSIPLQDFMWTWYTECLIQDTVLHQFRSHGFTGFDARPVHVRWEQPSDQPLPKFWEVEVTGWAGMAPPESGIRRIEKCAGCGRQVFTGFTNPASLIDKSQWDGSHFFLVYPLPPFFITNRVASYIHAQAFSGAEILAPDQIVVPKRVQAFGPLPLRYRFPEERARKLGEPLDIY